MDLNQIITSIFVSDAKDLRGFKSMNNFTKEESLAKLYYGLTDVINDYLHNARTEDEKKEGFMVSQTIVSDLREDTLNYLKEQMDLLIMGWRSR